MPGPLANRLMRSILNSPLHPMLGPGFAVVTVGGSKSGNPYSTPVNATRDGDTYTVLSLASRTWWRNLRGGRPATLRVSGRTLPVRGEVLEEPEQVALALGEHLTRHPGLGRYFKVRMDPYGRPEAQDLSQAAAGRVVVRLHAESAG